MLKSMELKFLNEQARKNGIPTYGGKPNIDDYGNAAIDLMSGEEKSIIVPPGKHAIVGTGLAIHISDPGIVGIVLPRSGLGFKRGIQLRNTAGVIDSNYQGEIKLAIENNGDTVFVIKPGDRIAQMMFLPIVHASFIEVEEFKESSSRGTNGFGSSGV